MEADTFVVSFVNMQKPLWNVVMVKSHFICLDQWRCRYHAM